METVKPFHACSIEEKLDRLAEGQRILAHQMIMMGKLATEAHNIAVAHEHVQGRGLMLPVGVMEYPGLWSPKPFERVLERLK